MFFNYDSSRDIQNIVRNNERYDKSKRVLSAREILEVGQSRYLLLQKKLLPIISILKNKLAVTNIKVYEDNELGLMLQIEYVINSHKGYIVLYYSNLENKIGIQMDTTGGEYNGLIHHNETTLINIIHSCEEEKFGCKDTLRSTSNTFTINLFGDYVRIVGNTHGSIEDYFEMRYIYNLFHDISYNEMIKHVNILTSFPKLNILLSDEEVLSQLFDHIKFYENDVPKHLVKKK